MVTISLEKGHRCELDWF